MSPEKQIRKHPILDIAPLIDGSDSAHSCVTLEIDGERVGIRIHLTNIEITPMEGGVVKVSASTPDGITISVSKPLREMSD